MNLDSLRDNLKSLKEQEDLTFIVNINFGTTTQAAFDDVFAIRAIMDDLKNPNWEYVVHMDAAMYGPTLPVLKQFGEKSDSLTSCGVDTVAISLWKFLGVQIPCGVSLCTRDFIQQGYGPLKSTIYKEFPFANDHFSLAGTRSGIAAAAAYNIIKTFKLEEGLEVLKKFTDYDIEMAIYL
jgi:glutamate/tyrosine decarboxylase-like PLP-dependent enzyme